MAKKIEKYLEVTSMKDIYIGGRMKSMVIARTEVDNDLVQFVAFILYQLTPVLGPVVFDVRVGPAVRP